MFIEKLLPTNTRAARFVTLCAFVFLVTTQSLSLAHEFAHDEHEQTELCELLNSFGASKAIIAHGVVLESFPHTQIRFAIHRSSLVNSKIVLSQRSRAPPQSLS